MKQALELERRRDEDESRRRREMAVTQESSTINVPSVNQTPVAGDVTLEVPNDVLKVSPCVCVRERERESESDGLFIKCIKGE